MEEISEGTLRIARSFLFSTNTKTPPSKTLLAKIMSRLYNRAQGERPWAEKAAFHTVSLTGDLTLTL